MGIFRKNKRDEIWVRDDTKNTSVGQISKSSAKLNTSNTKPGLNRSINEGSMINPSKKEYDKNIRKEELDAVEISREEAQKIYPEEEVNKSNSRDKKKGQGTAIWIMIFIAVIFILNAVGRMNK